MRTTLTLDEDVAILLREEMERSRLTLKEAVNTTLRRGLGSGLAPHAFESRPGIDLDKLGQLADELEDEATLGRLVNEQ